MTAPERLLLVDDDPSQLLTLCALLEEERYAVACASSYSEAAALLDVDASWVVALVDHHLGKANGMSVAELVRAKAPSATILMLSGNLPAEVLPPQLDGWILKGESFAQLLAAIASAREARATRVAIAVT